MAKIPKVGKCFVCKSENAQLVHDPPTDYWFIQCNSCALRMGPYYSMEATLEMWNSLFLRFPPGPEEETYHIGDFTLSMVTEMIEEEALNIDPAALTPIVMKMFEERLRERLLLPDIFTDTFRKILREYEQYLKGVSN